MAQIQQGRDLGFNTTGDFSASLTGSLVNSTSELMGIADHIIGIINPLGIKKQEVFESIKVMWNRVQGAQSKLDLIGYEKRPFE